MPDRIVSLAPSATTLVRALDAEDRLVGATDDGTIGGWLTPDLDRVVARDPDVVLTTDDLQEPIVRELRERDVATAHFSPRTLPDVLAYIRDVGDAIGRPEAADGLATSVEDRIESVRHRVAGRERPTVYCEEWDEPPMVAGNWVPDLVEAAGGSYPYLDAGARSRRIDHEEIEASPPTHAIVHVCGRGRAQNPTIDDRDGWEIPHVHAIDDALLNQPGPRLAAAVERLADVLHPETA